LVALFTFLVITAGVAALDDFRFLFFVAMCQSSSVLKK
jgi:hypothetical protein